MIYVFVGNVLFLILIMWFMICVDRTYLERNRALKSSELSWLDILYVHFYKHVWYRMTFRDPWELYPHSVKNVMKDK